MTSRKSYCFEPGSIVLALGLAACGAGDSSVGNPSFVANGTGSPPASASAPDDAGSVGVMNDGGSGGSAGSVPIEAGGSGPDAGGTANGGTGATAQDGGDNADGGAPAGGGGDGGPDGAHGMTYRIAYSSDGNQHDPDDLHASPMSLALIARAGLKDRLVHFDYNDHLGDNDPAQAKLQVTNVTEAVRLFGYDSKVIFDDQRDLSGAVASLAAAVNASSANDRLMLVCAGPMEVCWRGLDAADDNKEQFVTVISHSMWNDTHSDTPQLKHTWSDIKDDFASLAHHINDQNTPAFRSGCREWSWLKGIPSYGTKLHEMVCTQPSDAAGDASDAGMIWYVIKKGPITSGATGSSSPAMKEVQTFFGQ